MPLRMDRTQAHSVVSPDTSTARVQEVHRTIVYAICTLIELHRAKGMTGTAGPASLMRREGRIRASDFTTDRHR